MSIGRTRFHLGVTAALAFFVTVLGSNGPTPLFPLYVQDLGLTQLDVGIAFSAYFFGLVAALFTLARSRLSLYPQFVLPAALVLTAVADVVFCVMGDNVGLLCAARVCTGAAVGLATGPAATFALAALGESGRSMITTTAMLAASVGLGFSMVVVAVLPSPRTTVFVIHATVSVVVLVLLTAALINGRRVWRGSVEEMQDVSPAARPGGDVARTAVAYSAGALGWIVGAFAVGIVPTVLVSQDPDLSLVIAAVPGVACLTAAAAFQMLSTAVGRRMSLSMSLCVLAAGAVVTSVGFAAASVVVTGLGCVLFGIGQSPSYSGGFRILAGGLSPLQQGRFAATYSGICYLAAGLFVLVTGAAGTSWGVLGGTVSAITVFGVACVALAIRTALRPIEAHTDIENPAYIVTTAEVSPAQRADVEPVNLLNRSGTPTSSM
ncbi:MFS transporter [Rhodococcoides yunnanense]|uniref:MFS transporter n=1 Tax=Rhodococcoides yunnanense TaxID=278209 RepID=UPI000935640A|nr:MFS transporter [Rhodococcus yunnanensis]